MLSWIAAAANDWWEGRMQKRITGAAGPMCSVSFL
jgi:hypothetical protein